MQQIILATGFTANSGHFEAAERLAMDERPGDWPVEIKISDQKFAASAFKCRWAAAIDAAGEGVIGSVGNLQRLAQVFGAGHGEDGAKNFFLGDAGQGGHFGKNVRTDKPTLLRERAGIGCEDGTLPFWPIPPTTNAREVVR